jgi:hypothetical protein
MQRRLFLPTLGQALWLAIVVFFAVGYALYQRYFVLQVPEVSLACEAGRDALHCHARKLAMAFFQNNVFGVVALGAALLNLLRPSIVLVTVALAAAGFGIVLHNVSLSALAVALLVLSLARTAPLPE